MQLIKSVIETLHQTNLLTNTIECCAETKRCIKQKISPAVNKLANKQMDECRFNDIIKILLQRNF